MHPPAVWMQTAVLAARKTAVCIQTAGRGDVIDLYSDTQTRPVDGMRAAMAAAEVGDEQRGEDPTVNALRARVAALLGKPAAVFLPSGTMCNAIGFRLHIRPGGDAVHLHPTSHPIVA